MRWDGTGWARRAVTDQDRAEIAATPAPDGTAVYFYGIRLARAPFAGRPAQAGCYSAVITRYPSKWYEEAETPIAAFRLALAAMREEAVA